ncbi:phosphoribosylformylglycinamidine synthase subunit PurS [Aerococcus sanguinicola]|uniref:Phosphoribosylformylglycinamidine synthase subunit PurS n=2 Tax=Aerococcus TaxID=1375 RepID=A0A109RD45_9LACT|nr:phosphoribosylformylglycinamidine synthase [Aerococcus sanguinicola]OFT93753.1 phosphoribosylformylglycinamidine synthase [Aerococcus sp. HMSC23C02]PKZ20318.1 phosphoribosylformylglycinamidine synthase subunit PurS [Aerococcus sanguinicola]
MYQVEIFVTYKESILDPQGEAIQEAVNQMGYREVESVRQGKYFELEISKDVADVQATVEAICDKLLANVTMEAYRYTIKEA